MPFRPAPEIAELSMTPRNARITIMVSRDVKHMVGVIALCNGKTESELVEEAILALLAKMGFRKSDVIN